MLVKTNQYTPNTSKRFCAYSDESGCFSERFQAIGIVSGKEKHISKLRDILVNILHKKGLKEVKHSEVRTHKPKIEAAVAFVEKGVDFAKHSSIRIDILLWDTQDTRHSIPGRDDVANLERMYYKALRNVSERWRQNIWELYPDENSAINWSEIKSYLNSTQIPRRNPPNLISLFEEKASTINFHKIEPKKSHDEPLIQIADLFAGMACFCRDNGEECLKWLLSQKRSSQQVLFDYEEPGIKEDPNKTKQNRFKLIGILNTLCKRYRLGVSLNTKKYLWTPIPSKPLNFWNYESKFDDDKAPTK